MDTRDNNKTISESDEYFDYPTLAGYLKVNVRTLRNWKSAGKLPYTRIYGKILFPRREILKILRKNNIHATQTYFEEFTEKQDTQFNQNGGEK